MGILSDNDLSRSRKKLLRKIAELETTTTRHLFEEDDISDLFTSKGSLSNVLSELADADILEAERDGQRYEYSLSEKGRNRLQRIKKRERQRKEISDDIFDYENGINEFIEFFESDEYGYSEIESAGIGRRYVYLDYQLLEKFNVELADDLISDPERVLDACAEAVNSLPEINDEVDVRVKNVSDIETQTISDLSAKDLNRLVSVEGVIQSVSQPCTRMDYGIFECAQCGDRYEKKQETGKVKSPYKCDCGSRDFDVLRVKHNTVRFVRIKEKPTKRSRNKTVAILEGDIAEDESKNLEAIGSGVRVIGYLETYKKNKRDDYFTFRLNCNNIEVEETKWDLEELTDSEVDQIEEISRRDDLFNHLATSLAYEEIKNAELLKKAFLLWLLGRTRNFGNLHVLCVGDPGTAKSHLASIVEDRFGKVIKSVATGASKVGLTASVIKDEVTGEFTAEGGAFPMADGGFHITDEVDELEKEHYSAYNEALSDGSITLAKADIHTEITADVAEFSIGNPKYYSFDPYQELYKQIPIEKDDLISRFGLILAVQSNSSDSEESVQNEREKVDHILNRNDSSNFEGDDYVDPDLLRKYIYYAQRTYPVMTQDAKSELESAYMALFESQESGQNFVKPRHANALAILSLGFAKINLSDEVKAEHVEQAAEFFGRCYKSIGFEIGMDDFSDLANQNTRRKKAVLGYLKRQSESPVEVQNMAEDLDISESDVESVVDLMLREGELWEPKSGYIKKV